MLNLVVVLDRDLHVVHGDKDLIVRFLDQRRQRAVPTLATKSDPPALNPSGAALR